MRTKFMCLCCTPKFSLPYFSKHFKKDPQVAQGSPRVDQTSSLLRRSTSNRVSCYINIFESKGSKMLTIFLIFYQDHPCQVSIPTEKACSVNCSKAWKSTVLGQKSTMAHIQSSFKIFGQHYNLKYYSSFDQGLIMTPQGLLIIHQNPNVPKLGFCRKSQLNFDQA